MYTVRDPKSGKCKECFKLQFQWKLQCTLPSSVQCMQNKSIASPLGTLFLKERIFPQSLGVENLDKRATDPSSSCSACIQLGWTRSYPCAYTKASMREKQKKEAKRATVGTIGAPSRQNVWALAPPLPPLQARRARTTPWPRTHPAPRKPRKLEGRFGSHVSALTQGKLACAKKSW